MKQLQRVAFIGNHLPRRCGIATFTHDLHRAVATARPDLETCVVAMTDPGRTYDYPPAVRFQIRDDVIGDYVQAAELLNNAGFDVASLQHEYGIFGGEAGGNIIELLSRLEMPIVTTLHTVLSQPTPVQRDVMRRIIDASTKIVVMSEKGLANSCVPFMTCQRARSRSYRTAYPTSRSSKRITPRRNSAFAEKRSF